VKLDGRKLAMILLLVALAGISWYLAHIAGESETVFNGKSRHDPDYVVENFHAVSMNSTGTPQYELRGKRLTHYGDDDSSVIDQPYVIQYESGRAPTHARSRLGFVPKDTPYIELTGNVHVAHGRDPVGAGTDLRVEKFVLTLNRSGQ
jgi:lipopolysaccharide export system protein LptC